MYHLDTTNFHNILNDDNNEMTVCDFSKYKLTFEKTPQNRNPPRRLHGRTYESWKENHHEIIKDHLENNIDEVIWSKFDRDGVMVWGKHENVGETWQGFTLKRNYVHVVPWQHFNHLRYLNVARCHIKEMPIIPQNLTYLNISHNLIKTVPAMPQHLRIFKANNCNIHSMANVSPNLQYLSVRSNKLLNLPEDSILRHQTLRYINYEYNPDIQLTHEFLVFLEDFGGQIQRDEWIPHDRPARARQPMAHLIPPRQNVYGDGQNVHNTNITEEGVKNFKLLVKKVEDQKCLIKLKDIVKILEGRKQLKKHANHIKFVEYLHKNGKNATHSTLKTNVLELYEHVFSFFTKLPSEEQDNFLERYVIELEELNIVCVTGIIMRLLNLLTGFLEGIKFEITQEQQISAKVNVINKKIEEEIDSLSSPEPFKDVVNLYDKIKMIQAFYSIYKKYSEKMRENLTEIDVPLEKITEWCFPLEEEMSFGKEMLDEISDVIDFYESGKIMQAYLALYVKINRGKISEDYLNGCEIAVKYYDTLIDFLGEEENKNVKLVFYFKQKLFSRKNVDQIGIHDNRMIQLGEEYDDENDSNFLEIFKDYNDKLMSKCIIDYWSNDELKIF
jgi:hypothetical protein